MAITTLVFDFGNVVARFSHRQAAEQLAAYGTAAAPALQAYLFGGQLEEDFEAGRIAPAVFIGMVRETFHLHCSDAEFIHAFSDMFVANPEVCELLPRLQPHYRLLLLSNTNVLHADHFLAQFREELRPFAKLVLSHAVGLRKPDPRIYEYCREQAGAPPAAECLFVDDLPANIDGVRACGWQGLVYRPGENLTEQLTELGIRIAPVSRRVP